VKPLYAAAYAVTWLPLRLLYRLRATGSENLPREGGFVLAANHVSNFDPWPLGVPLYPRHELRFMAKSELFNPVLGPLLHGVGAFRIRRGTGDAEAMATAVRLAREGEVVAMFPHGTRSRKGRRKKLQPRPHTGAARIALEAGVPLVPAAIKGTDRLLRLGPVRVAYGPQIELSDLGEDDLRRASDIATQRLIAAIGRLEASL
jgi:1-acyl-sn-glycerol-3-phosphate acyltransferase